MLLLLILFLECSIMQGLDIDIKRGFILEEDNSKEIVKNKIYHANTFPIIELAFGEPKQTVKMVVDTFTSYSWIWNGTNHSMTRYNSLLSSTFNYTTGEIDVLYEYKLFKMKGSHASDVIWIDNKLITNANRYGFIICTSIKNESLNINGYISLPKIHHNATSDPRIQYGLIQYLTNEKLIDNPIFSIYYTSDTKGVLKIGELNSLIEEDKVSYCSMKDTNKTKVNSIHSDKWECKLYLVSFGSLYVQSNNSTVLFGIGQEHIFAPIEHMGLLEAIKQEAEKYSSNCFIREQNKVTTLRCEEFDLNQEYFQSLELQLKTYRLIIKPIDLFVWSVEEDDLLECVVHINRNMASWLLGDPGLKREYVIFDSFNDRIGFVDKEYVSANLIPSFFNSIWLYFAVWLFFSVVWYYMIILNKKKRRPSRKPNELSTKFVN